MKTERELLTEVVNRDKNYELETGKFFLPREMRESIQGFLKIPNLKYPERCPKCGKDSCYVICGDEGCGGYASDVLAHLF